MPAVFSSQVAPHHESDRQLRRAVHARSNSWRVTPRSRRMALTVPVLNSRLPQLGMVVLPSVDERIQTSWSPRARLSISHPSRRNLRVSSLYLTPQP